jgi:hypothetical protein
MDNANENIEEQNRTLSDSEISAAAKELMDRFDEAFKELAK